MSAPVTVVALLFVNPDRHAEFAQFEARASAIMRRHGGEIERRIAFPPPLASTQPHELHVVGFPSAEAFQSYRHDPDLQALASLRARAIRQTVVWVGAEAPSFSDIDAG